MRAVDGVSRGRCEAGLCSARSSLGAEPADIPSAQKTLDVPAIKGIGGSLLYFVDRYGAKGSAYDAEFEWLGANNPRPEGAGLFYLDHLTHNVHRGRMDVWTGFYEKLFNFRQIRFFDIEGRASGLFSRALTSPDGKIRIPINEDAGDSGQIEEYLNVYRGEGIQHIACGARDIYRTVETLRADGLPFMPSPPETYFEKIDARLPKHGEDVARLQRDGILIDGEGVVDGGHTKVLLQIFSANAIGPIFFEFIQRKGDDGFGEGNFKALFELIEEDQIRRGVLKVETRRSPGRHAGRACAPESTAGDCGTWIVRRADDGWPRCYSPRLPLAASARPISAVSASRIADGVREKRGAGAGWVTPWRVDEDLARGHVRMLRRFRHGQDRREADVGAFHDRAPFVARLALEHLRQLLLQRRPGLAVHLGVEVGVGTGRHAGAAARRIAARSSRSR